MLAEISHGRSQSLLKQRNMLAVFALALISIVLMLVLALSTKDREMVLQPVLSRPLTLSSAGISPEYFELVTRDTAVMVLNRTPSGLDYWMEQVLKVVHPSAYGRVKNALTKIVAEQKGSDVAQAFAMTRMTVDPKRLVSEVTGTVTTYVGTKIIASDVRTFRFRWSYSGLSLSLVEFGELVADHAGAAS
ncbi:type IV conjugative transfer system protein TraE (plasmid) [Polymorphobacter sp. PAMC 29334]|uniref:type IV conjugative transfer system protein TraE n=1 Tax=Polymorphobacter sp. PAMC 29334 TaxID=2862331 RepID=UPI001C7917A5|nr:type IV conjugative transfer system protein TraE [Polymorphobacter sp. PAMC 29334]QYE33133.1 type IV conjugative transfer system protein TraE [Polymorphobacter sp. PAMC 29334]